MSQERNVRKADVSRTLLNGEWAMWSADREQKDAIAVTVPGDVITALVSAGEVPDPYLDSHSTSLDWVGESDWIYEREFAVSAISQRVDLVFEGLDTVTTIFVNEVEIARTENMHRTYRFDVRTALRLGRNNVRVIFHSPTAYSRSHRDRLGELPATFAEAAPFIRKMAANFGWDWGPTLVTAGIWRDVYLESWNTARLARIDCRLGDDRDEAVATVEVEGTAGATLDAGTLIVQLGNQSAKLTTRTGQTSYQVSFPAQDLQRWAPSSLGVPTLHQLSVRLEVGGRTIDAATRSIGLRTVDLVQTQNTAGTTFDLLINGKRLAVRGFNWIPDGCFPARRTKDDYRQRLEQARSLNANLIRVWAGGIYESEDFYDICDELGLVVWQDYLFACAGYPEEQPFAQEVEAEAIENAQRLSGHPSLAVLNGNNENLWFHDHFDWASKIPGRTWGETYYWTTLPRITAESAPGVLYVPGSPWSGSTSGDHNSPSTGTMHAWIGGEFDGDIPAYETIQPSFVSEFGYPSAPRTSTLRESLSTWPSWWTDEAVALRQKAGEWNKFLDEVISRRFCGARSLDEWLWKTNYAQSIAIGRAIRHFRSLDRNSGMILWQLNDCWPGFSWSVIDGAGRFKLAAHEVARSYEPRAVAIAGVDGRARVRAINDTDQSWVEHARVRWFAHGVCIQDKTKSFEVPPRSIVTAADLKNPLSDDTFCVVDAGGRRDSRAFGSAPIRDAEPTDIDIVAEAIPGQSRTRVRVTAHTPIHGLTFDPGDRWEIEGAQLCVLLPGESAEWETSATQPQVQQANFSALVRGMTYA